MIKIEDLLYRYAKDSPPALDRVSLAIGEGEHVALIGPNGCGKTTLAKHMNGLLLPMAGDVTVDGMTLEEDVAFGPGNLRLPPVEIRDRVDRALAAVGLTPYKDRHPHTLSGGEKQLLALAGILAMDPRYIVLDEPTSHLDPAAKSKVLAMMTGLKSRGITIIHATHAMEDAASADRVVVMDKGRIVADGDPAAIFSRVEWLKDLGLAPPPIAELLWRLRARGVMIEPGVFTMEEAVEALHGLKTKLCP
jgi:biotin transport system ATP-binding protein/energy-coupling factor transport system ATP-binding protein